MSERSNQVVYSKGMDEERKHTPATTNHIWKEYKFAPRDQIQISLNSIGINVNIENGFYYYKHCIKCKFTWKNMNFFFTNTQ